MAQAGRIAGAAKMMPFITGLTVFFLILFVLVTGLRLYARIRLLRIGFRWDDGFLCVSTFFAIVFSGAIFYMADQKKLVERMNPPNIQKIQEIYIRTLTATWVASLAPIIYIGFLELSILSLYYQISAPQTIFRTCVILTFVFVILRTIGCVIIELIECIPLRKMWDQKIPGKCLNVDKIWISFAVLRASTSLVVYVLPIPHVLSLQMTRKRKAQLVGLFTLGGVSCITSFIRMARMFRAKTPTVDLVENIYLTIVEVGLALLCASLPALRVYFNPLIPILGRWSTAISSRISSAAPRTAEDDTMGVTEKRTLRSEDSAPRNMARFRTSKLQYAGMGEELLREGSNSGGIVLRELDMTRRQGSEDLESVDLEVGVRGEATSARNGPLV